jgi:hypothetical protein
MKYSTVNDVLANFTHPILPTVEGEPDYRTIHTTSKFLQSNSRAIDTHLGGCTLGHLGITISDAAYSNISPPTAGEPTAWKTPNAPEQARSNNVWNSGPTRRRSPRLGRRYSNPLDLHFRPASIEEVNHWRLRANVLGNIESQYGGLRQHLHKRHVGAPL